MNVINFNETCFSKPIVIALGLFDTIHLAHRHIVQVTKNIAKELNINSAIFTFDNNPKDFFKLQTSKMVYDFETRCGILNSLNLDYIIYQNFNFDFANLTPEDFFNKLVNNYDVRAIVCGFDYTFGKNATGSVNDLIKFCEQKNIKLSVVEKIYYDNIKISTTTIVEYLLNGKIEKANKLLGESYQYSGNVEHGHAVGRNLGFATANIKIKDNLVILKEGVYAGYCIVDGNRYKAIINVGKRITFGDENKKIEAHLLDFKENIYNKKLTIFFEKFLREQKKFSSREDLINQLNIDLNNARENLL